MRRLISAAGALLCTSIFLLHCTSDSSDSSVVPIGGNDATAPDAGATSCTQYCEQQANIGALTGTFQQCVDDCCSMAPRRCPSNDAASTQDGPAVDTGSMVGPDGSMVGPDGSMVVPEAGADGPSCATPCGGTCCGAKEACSTASGTPTCVQTCTTAADCPTTMCCAPTTNSAGYPVGPYVCKPDDGNSYDCCAGITVICGTAHCCILDNNMNEFCAQPCTSDSDCNGTHCLAVTAPLESSCSTGSTVCLP